GGALLWVLSCRITRKYLACPGETGRGTLSLNSLLKKQTVTTIGAASTGSARTVDCCFGLHLTLRSFPRDTPSFRLGYSFWISTPKVFPHDHTSPHSRRRGQHRAQRLAIGHGPGARRRVGAHHHFPGRHCRAAADGYAFVIHIAGQPVQSWTCPLHHPRRAIDAALGTARRLCAGRVDGAQRRAGCRLWHPARKFLDLLRRHLDRRLLRRLRAELPLRRGRLRGGAAAREGDLAHYG